MNDEDDATHDALRRAEEARRAVLERESYPLRPLGEINPPRVVPLGTKKQLTVPVVVRKRWAKDVSHTPVIAVQTSGDGILLVPRPPGWTFDPTMTRTVFPVAVQKGGNFEIPKPVRQRWAGVELLCLDLGYAYLIFPRDNAPHVLSELWGES